MLNIYQNIVSKQRIDNYNKSVSLFIFHAYQNRLKLKSRNTTYI